MGGAAAEERRGALTAHAMGAPSSWAMAWTNADRVAIEFAYDDLGDGVCVWGGSVACGFSVSMGKGGRERDVRWRLGRGEAMIDEEAEVDGALYAELREERLPVVRTNTTY
jgi:hypothetical protein